MQENIRTYTIRFNYGEVVLMEKSAGERL